MCSGFLFFGEVGLVPGGTNDETFVEGVSNEVLALFTVLITVFVAAVANYWTRDARTEHIHPDVEDDVQGFRESLTRVRSGREDEARRIEAEHADAVHTCPICYDDARYPILTNCGHIFCCECTMGYWRHSASLMAPVRCAICRSEVTVLLPLRWSNNDEETDRLLENNIGLNDYNRRFSGNRPLLEYLWDVPVLIPYIVSNLFDFNGLMVMFRMRILFITIGMLAYILSPFDIIPESAYGLMGLIDDVFVTMLLLVYIVIAVRHLMARQGELPP